MNDLDSLVDPAPLRRLRSDFGGDETVQNRFVNDFVALWQTRENRLETALAVADLDDADIVLLSIRSSSHMLGAVRLEKIAGRLHNTVKNRDLPGCRQQLPGLCEVGTETCWALSQSIAS